MSHTKQKGFTLIEVVLVLAIGGLIFLLAFLAFSQASANRRDTQRRSDARRLLAAIETFNGDIGSHICEDSTSQDCHANSPSFINFKALVFDTSNFKVPGTNSDYTLNGYRQVSGDGYNRSAWFIANSPSPTRLIFGYKANCENGMLVHRNMLSTSTFAVAALLEKGHYCIDNK